jgi:hypothetical protein
MTLCRIIDSDVERLSSFIMGSTMCGCTKLDAYELKQKNRSLGSAHENFDVCTRPHCSKLDLYYYYSVIPLVIQLLRHNVVYEFSIYDIITS